nr:374_t:CDS:2 [Entrophospora candida]CAG8571358.1 13744_t:CDS:2 [Entrophospora candida]
MSPGSPSDDRQKIKKKNYKQLGVKDNDDIRLNSRESSINSSETSSHSHEIEIETNNNANVARSYEIILDDVDLNWSFLIIIGGIFFICLIWFTLYHTSLILSNQTTIESLQKHNYKIRENTEVTTSKFLNLFDIGRRNNWKQVMGPTWHVWFFPTGSDPYVDGRNWPLNVYRYNTLCESTEELNP